MNGSQHHQGSLKPLLLCGLSLLLLVPAVPAQPLAYYVNNAVVTSAFNIDATNFINNNSFTPNTFLPYETTHTLNYTNNGTMNNSGGFVFDTLSGGVRTAAASVYNPGSISVGGGANLIVAATNLVSPGTLDAGLNGGIFLTGQKVDLSYATLTMEQQFSGFTAPGSGAFGTDTNGDWDPSIRLTATSATSSQPQQYVFTASAGPAGTYKAYADTPVAVGTNVMIFRAVFLGNLNTNNITTKAYFPAADALATVEWDGIYTDPATGLLKTNYLYLNNNYVLGTRTNLTLPNGYPANFTVSQSTTPDPTLTTPATPGVVSTNYAPGVVTNNPYSYARISITPTTVEPNTPTSGNPSGALTNLPARIEINAGGQLNLALSTIRGQPVGGIPGGLNFLSLTCTNQFLGAAGATIVAPYSDINLGVTNGNLTISNVLQSVIPAWSGSITAWSTQWSVTDAGVTNIFRVLIVSSSLIPFSSPQVQNLTLRGTNMVISDVLNIMNHPLIDAQRLTLTANNGYPTNGAGSPYGQLNFESSSTLIASSLPNLLWLTNHGAITISNDAYFGGPPPANYNAFVNDGFITDQGTTIYSTYFRNSGNITNGSGNFSLQSQTAAFTGGTITNAGDFAVTADSLVLSNTVLRVGRSLTLQATNLLTDNGGTNRWSVAGSGFAGINLPIHPAAGDLRGTIITMLAAANKNVVNTWAGADRGPYFQGYTNNAAIGRLILNAVSAPPHSLFTFQPAGGTNALYVDNLYLTNTAATFNSATSNATALAISPGMVVYYQKAYSNGVDVSSIINHWNNNQLQLVATNYSASILLAPPPASPAGAFNLSISGVQLPAGVVTGAAYNVIIQASSNLFSPNWVNVYTGTPPFTFSDFGVTNHPQQFYRATQGW